MHIIIDGYNLIRQSESLRRFERISLEEGRKELVARLSAYKRYRGCEITVVFDGWIDGAYREEHLKQGGVNIVYSKRGEKADEVIKRLARRKGVQIIVVTSDRDVAGTAERAGGVALASTDFEFRMAVSETVSAPEEFFPGLSDDGEAERDATTKKKGPSRRLSKRARQAERVLKKL